MSINPLFSIDQTPRLPELSGAVRLTDGEKKMRGPYGEGEKPYRGSGCCVGMLQRSESGPLLTSKQNLSDERRARLLGVSRVGRHSIAGAVRHGLKP